MTIRNVFVMGAGLMGSGIAQVCAQAGLSVSLYDVDQAALEKSLKSLAWSLGKLVEKGKVTESLEKIVGRISPAHSLKPAGQAQLAIEAVFENLELKRKVFAQMDEQAGPDTLLASNTSAISITELAAATKRPDRVLGLHFFSPVPMMQAVEVIRGISTSDETFEAGRRFVLDIGKEPILVRRDIGGFLINRINFMANTEAMRLVEEGVATVEDIDKGLRLASGRKMGIFETGDMVGLDVTLGALNAVYEETKDPRFYPPLILRRKVKAGELGKKTGKGWYVYDEQGNRLGPAKVY
ncbi:MAG: 3-hydroxyacyl-CoA dehydrogenase family protein [Thermodesulfobacteriota bacterium]